MNEPASLKELIEQRIDLSLRRIDSEFQRVWDRFTGVIDRLETSKLNGARALELQAKEYERRLEQLNQAHARAEDVLNTYVTREIYFKSEDEHGRWQEGVDKELNIQRGRDASKVVIGAAVLAGLGLLIGILNLIARYIH